MLSTPPTLGSSLSQTAAPATNWWATSTFRRAGSGAQAFSTQPMASLYEQALLVIADALVMKMAAESGAPESELFKRHANLE